MRIPKPLIAFAVGLILSVVFALFFSPFGEIVNATIALVVTFTAFFVGIVLSKNRIW